MTLFWIVSGTAALAVAAILALTLLRGRTSAGADSDHDLSVYRDQLREIDRDAARGAIPPEEAERLRTEVSRRILSADARTSAAAPQAAQPRGPALVLTALLVPGLLIGAFALYWELGAPGYRDLGLQDRIARAQDARATRPDQAEAETRLPASPTADAPADYVALVEKLRATVKTRPDDAQGHMLLARSEAALGNYAAAYAAQQALIALRGDAATAQDYADLADMMVLAAGGYVSPQTERVLDEIMRRDPENGVARYYGGLMMAQTGRPDAAFRIWDRLLRDSPADAAWIAPVLSQIPELALLAGINDYDPPLPGPAIAGPGADDIDAASEMNADDRQAMIQGMVDRLGERLATQGGSPQEWAQLIGALGVLGDTDRAAAIWAEAKIVFATSPEALGLVEQAAKDTGVAQ